MLLCPKCGNKLVREERVWRCQNNHSYDIAKLDMSIWRCIIKHSAGMIGKW